MNVVAILAVFQFCKFETTCSTITSHTSQLAAQFQRMSYKQFTKYDHGNQDILHAMFNSSLKLDRYYSMIASHAISIHLTVLEKTLWF